MDFCCNPCSAQPSQPPLLSFTPGLLLPETQASTILARDESELRNYERVTTQKGLLGQGAFGHVFLMRHKPTGRLVALKVVYKRNVISSLRALAQEIEIHKRIVHDNIIRLYEFMEGPKCIYIVMEYASMGTLFSYIRLKKRLEEKEAFRLFWQACNAISFLHSHRLMHRDIKPENLLFTDSGTLKLADFGCCTSLAGERKSFCGTAEYIAPEIIKGLAYDEKADIWSLGVLLYEMLHGRSPFSGKEKDVATKVLQNKLVFAPEISEDAKSLILSMLSNDPSARPDVAAIFDSAWARRMASQPAEKHLAILAAKASTRNHEEYKSASANLHDRIGLERGMSERALTIGEGKTKVSLLEELALGDKHRPLEEEHALSARYVGLVRAREDVKAEEGKNSFWMDVFPLADDQHV